MLSDDKVTGVCFPSTSSRGVPQLAAASDLPASSQLDKTQPAKSLTRSDLVRLSRQCGETLVPTTKLERKPCTAAADLLPGQTVTKSERK